MKLLQGKDTRGNEFAMNPANGILIQKQVDGDGYELPPLVAIPGRTDFMIGGVTFAELVALYEQCLG